MTTVYTMTTKVYQRGEIIQAYNDGVFKTRKSAIDSVLSSVIPYVLDLDNGGYYEISDFIEKYNETIDGIYQVRVFDDMGRLILSHTISKCFLRG